MPQSLAQILIHIIFSTKGRYRFLASGIRPELYAYAAVVLQNLDSPPVAINGTDDHIHILCRLSKNSAVCDVIQKVKTATSTWIKSKGGVVTKFAWQNGYGAFSVSPSQVADVRRYIENQEVHHRTVGFEEEFRRFLEKYGVEFDERYVWD